jgi:hypothetical protein
VDAIVRPECSEATDERAAAHRRRCTYRRGPTDDLVEADHQLQIA